MFLLPRVFNGTGAVYTLHIYIIFMDVWPSMDLPSMVDFHGETL